MKKITDLDVLAKVAIVKGVTLSAVTGTLVVAILMIGVVAVAAVVHLCCHLLALIGFHDFEKEVQGIETLVLLLAVMSILFFTLHLVDKDIDQLKQFGRLVEQVQRLVTHSKAQAQIEATPMLVIEQKPAEHELG